MIRVVPDLMRNIRAGGAPVAHETGESHPRPGDDDELGPPCIRIVPKPSGSGSEGQVLNDGLDSSIPNHEYAGLAA